jgi:alpha-N-acetylglucosamine transferase
MQNTTVQYILDTVKIDESNDVTFEAFVKDSNDTKAVHADLTISTDLLSLLCSDDLNVQSETVAMLQALYEHQVIGQFSDDEDDNMRHCLVTHTTYGAKTL